MNDLEIKVGNIYKWNDKIFEKYCFVYKYNFIITEIQNTFIVYAYDCDNDKSIYTISLSEFKNFAIPVLKEEKNLENKLECNLDKDIKYGMIIWNEEDD